MHETTSDFQAFIQYANAGRYRDALLALEEVWKVERHECYAGILQLLVALNQMQSGMKPRRTLQRARERIVPCAPTFAGLDIVYLLSIIESCEAILPPDDTMPLLGDVPTLRLEIAREP